MPGDQIAFITTGKTLKLEGETSLVLIRPTWPWTWPWPVTSWCGVRWERLFQSEERGRHEKVPVRWRCDPRKTPDPQMGRVPGGMARPRPAQLLTHLSHSLCPRMGNCNSTELYNNPQSQWHFKNVIQGKCEIFQIIGHRPLRSLQGHLGIRTFQEDLVLLFICLFLVAFAAERRLSLVAVSWVYFCGGVQASHCVASLVLWSVGSRAQDQ